MRHRQLNSAVIAVFISLLAGCGGCRDSEAPSDGNRQDNKVVSEQYSEDLLTYAVDNLGRLDEFGSSRVMAQMSTRLQDLAEAEENDPDRPFDPLLTAWPESEMLRQIVNRLNQWLQDQQPSAGWSPDPMIESLPEPMAELPQVKDLAAMEFSRFDGYALREAAWLRDVSKWTGGDTIDELQRAGNIFDWMVRNIQIENDYPDRIPMFPWETLLFGRGTADERVWLFILLLRQAKIDAALLAFDEERGEKEEEGEKDQDKKTDGGLPELPPLKKTAAERLRPWCVGVLIDGKAYLFDPQLGLPIPAPDGVAMDKSGQLKIRPATLAEVRADKKLLERMNAGELRTYGVRPADLDRLAVLLEASPQYLSYRMGMLESRLSGDQRMTLTTSPTAAAKRWSESAGIDGARLWLKPYQTLLRRSKLNRLQVITRLASMLQFYIAPSAPLLHGRTLYLKGQLVGDNGAMKYYQAARPPHAALLASSINNLEKRMYLLGKQDATYWCGLIVYQRGDYDAAVDYFKKRTLETYRSDRWNRGARYNLARSYEASGQTDRAILLYGSDVASPGYQGDLLRAKWLRELSDKANNASSE